MNTLEAALAYEILGFSIIPVNKDKTPFIKWIPYQTKRPTPEEIKKWWKEWPSANLAIITGPISGIYVIDIDSPKGKEAISPFISDSPTPPTVNTPKGGWHLYYKYPEIDLGNTARLITDCDSRGNGGYVVAPPSINGKGGGWTWEKGLSLNDIVLGDLPKKYIACISSSIKNNSFSVCVADPKNDDGNNWERTATTGNIGRFISFDQPGRDETLFHIANSLFRSGMPEENVRKVVEFIGCNCKPAFPPRELEAKIKSVLQRAEKRERPITEELRDFIDRQQVGTFRLQDAYNHLQVATRDDKKAVQIALRRMDGGLVEKVGSVLGTYRIVDKTIKRIDLGDKSDIGNELDIKFPMGIHEFIKPMPGCIYVVAGEPDSGKSAYLMNFAKKNSKENKVHYFSSEMGKEEFLDRLQYSWLDASENKNMNFYERDGDFDQVIFPDDINIVDYLTLFDNFYLMAGLINAIGKKLKKGIAFVAIQKPRGRDEALGGDRTKDLARLYITMEYQKMRIIKAKNWRDPKFNPNKLSICYELHRGFDFKTTTSWTRETK